jgi:hypothetical protein
MTVRLGVWVPGCLDAKQLEEPNDLVVPGCEFGYQQTQRRESEEKRCLPQHFQQRPFENICKTFPGMMTKILRYNPFHSKIILIQYVSFQTMRGGEKGAFLPVIVKEEWVREKGHWPATGGLGTGILAWRSCGSSQLAGYCSA